MKPNPNAEEWQPSNMVIGYDPQHDQVVCWNSSTGEIVHRADVQKGVFVCGCPEHPLRSPALSAVKAASVIKKLAGSIRTIIRSYRKPSS